MSGPSCAVGDARLPVSPLLGPPPYAGPERRHLEVREQLLRRVRSEFEEMPGLRLTFAQARVLFNLEPACCERVLDALLKAGYLVRTRSDQVGRRDLVA